jgi:hypothetical protein
MNMMNRAKAHKEIDRIFLELLPQRGMAVREAQVRLCHDMLSSMDSGKIALCDAGVGLGKTYAYLAAGILFRKYTENASERPVLISTASIALQNAVLDEYIPFLSEVMMEDGIIDRPLKAVLRKGKSHYVCDDRLIKRLANANLNKKNERNKQALLSLKSHLDLDDVPHLSAYDRNQVCVPGMPQKSIPIETAYAQATTGESMMFAGVRGSNGSACGGMFMASLWNTNPYYVGGVDMTPTSAMHVTGVIAPTEDFLNVEATLTQAVFSLRFTEEYIQDAIAYSKAVGEAAMADNAARQAVFDKANKAWSEYFRGGPTIDSDNLNKLNDLLDTIKDALG